tara:strand:- start:2181 stop:3578 length:1398 start_codon:yes stop_codon:yes gene_type:complete
MAIRNLFQGLGQRVGRGLTAVGGYDPMQQVSPEEAARRRQEGLAALQRSLGRSSAILSGDPRRLALAEEQTQRAEQDKLLQQLAQDPRYAEQIKLLRAGLDPRLAARASVERKIIKGADGYNYYVNPDGSFERVLPGIQIPEDKSGDTEFERNITELNRLKSIPTDQLTETDKRNIKIYENKLLKTTAPKIFQVVGPNNERAGLATYDEFVEGQKSGLYAKGSTIVNIPTGTEAPKAPKPEVFSVENKPFADKWQATSNLQQNLQNYTNELQKMDEAALTGVGAGATFANSLIQNTKGFLNLASKDTKSFYNEAVAKDSYTTLEGNDFTERLKAVSRQTGVNQSQVRDLAYLFAAARGQEGRGLSDKDYDNALQIVSGGVGKEGKIAVIESVYNRLGGEISNAVDGRIRTLQYLKENSPEIEASYFDRQITQLNALKEANPFNPYINPLKQESLKPDPYKLRPGT